MENQKGEVQAISQQNNAVQIDDVWYDLGPKVKMNYIKKGPCEYSTEETDGDANDLVVFCGKPKGDSPNSNGTVNNPKGLDNTSNDMTKMAALKFAGNVYMGTGQESDAKVLTESALNFLEKGVWISTEKVQ